VNSSVLGCLKDVGSWIEMIVRGWKKCGLTRPFEWSFQAEAMKATTSRFLFGLENSNSDKEEFNHDAKLEELFADENITDLMAKCVF
jgi:hypothetical protein